MSKSKKTMKGVTCKNGYWYARIDGQEKYCGKGEKGKKLAEAAKAKEIARSYENKEINVGIKVKRTEFKKVRDISKWYMSLPSVQAKKGYIRNQNATKHLLEYFGKKPVNYIEPDEQERYRQNRIGQGAADATVNYEIALLSAMYNLALKRKKIPVEVMPGEFVRKGSSPPRRIITEDEFEQILKHSDIDFQDLLICGYETAMRLSEIANLTKSQIHLDLQHISGSILDYIDLGIFETKTGTRRTIPISSRLKEVFIRRMVGLKPDDLVFTEDDYQYYVSFVANRLRAACKKAGVIYGDKVFNKKGERVGIVFHCLRHTRTTKWVEMGFSDEIIRRATGHRSLDAYQQYVKLGPQSVMRLVKKSKRDKNETKSLQSLME